MKTLLKITGITIALTAIGVAVRALAKDETIKHATIDNATIES